jgi:hypothetical protein
MNFHWRKPSIKKHVSLAVLGVQAGFVSLASESLKEQVQVDIIAEDDVKQQSSRNEANAKASEMFLFCVQV